ncbi:hypothetical protein D3C87_1381180 [compost metagenome]
MLRIGKRRYDFPGFGVYKLLLFALLNQVAGGQVIYTIFNPFVFVILGPGTPHQAQPVCKTVIQHGIYRLVGIFTLVSIVGKSCGIIEEVFLRVFKFQVFAPFLHRHKRVNTTRLYRTNWQ